MQGVSPTSTKPKKPVVFSIDRLVEKADIRCEGESRMARQGRQAKAAGKAEREAQREAALAVLKAVPQPVSKGERS